MIHKDDAPTIVGIISTALVVITIVVMITLSATVWDAPDNPMRPGCDKHQGIAEGPKKVTEDGYDSIIAICKDGAIVEIYD